MIYGNAMVISLEELHKICDKCVGLSGIFFHCLDLWREKNTVILEGLKKSSYIDNNLSFRDFIFEHMSLASLSNAF